MVNDKHFYGGILCDSPLVTLGKRRATIGEPLGLLTERPEFFEGRRSLNFVMLAWTHEDDASIKELAADLKEIAKRLPLSQNIILANTRRELELFRASGIPAIEGNLLLFTNENDFWIEPDCSTDVVATYVGTLAPYKRHELACNIDDLALLYWRPSDEILQKIQHILPHAIFRNHQNSTNEYRLIRGKKYCQMLARSKVGLCLSRYEGPMRASMEYALCGLPIVSTESFGGRIEVLRGRQFNRIVSDDPDDIARAVDELAAEKFNAQEVRKDAILQLEKMRYDFLRQIDNVLIEVFGSDAPQLKISDFQNNGSLITRKISTIFGNGNTPL